MDIVSFVSYERQGSAYAVYDDWNLDVRMRKRRSKASHSQSEIVKISQQTQRN